MTIYYFIGFLIAIYFLLLIGLGLWVFVSTQDLRLSMSLAAYPHIKALEITQKQLLLLKVTNFVRGLVLVFGAFAFVIELISLFSGR